MKKYNCVLLIDDDGTANFTNYRIIKKLALSDNIETVFNGEKALNFIQFYADKNGNKSPELILLDLKMPVLDGYEFLEYFYRKRLENFDDVNVIILSSFISPSAEQEKFQKKFPHISYLEKPLKSDSLLKILSDRSSNIQNG